MQAARTLLPAMSGLALFACGPSVKESHETAMPAAGEGVVADAGDLLPALAPLDYGRPESWLCRPEIADACDSDVSATSIAANGDMTQQRFAADPDAPVDCFYVYPTVSTDQTPNSDAQAGDGERRAAAMQAGRFGSACRIYAPIYRQVSVTALQAMLSGQTTASDRELAYADVREAWARYLADDNEGRGVVLIGHDQGAGLLARLIAAEIEGMPEKDRIVAAILPGAPIMTDTFRDMSPCVSDEDVGCLISFAAFRADAPPAAGALFGVASEEGASAICVNPAELDGSQGALKALLPADPENPFIAEPGPWVAGAAPPVTPMVAAPGLLSGACRSDGGFAWLDVTTNADPLDPRTDVIVGDVIIDGVVQPAWGLHLYDMNLVLGNLVEVVTNLSAAYASREVARVQHPEAQQ